MKKERYDVLERTKVNKTLSEKMDKYCLNRGWSRSQLIREALTQFFEYEENLVQREIKDIRLEMSALKEYISILVESQLKALQKDD